MCSDRHGLPYHTIHHVDTNRNGCHAVVHYSLHVNASEIGIGASHRTVHTVLYVVFVQWHGIAANSRLLVIGSRSRDGWSEPILTRAFVPFRFRNQRYRRGSKPSTSLPKRDNDGEVTGDHRMLIFSSYAVRIRESGGFAGCFHARPSTVQYESTIRLAVMGKFLGRHGSGPSVPNCRQLPSAILSTGSFPRECTYGREGLYERYSKVS